MSKSNNNKASSRIRFDLTQKRVTPRKNTGKAINWLIHIKYTQSEALNNIKECSNTQWYRLMTSVALKNICINFGEIPVLHDINLNVSSGEFVVVVGPSGCGKSTLLRVIAGFETPDSGQVLIEGKDVADVHPAKRDIAMVFQSYALYSHMSVRDNLSFSMRVHHTETTEVNERIEDAAEFLQLAPYLDRMPGSLSGGQRQRVAIGRAIIRKPGIFLFDEPLSNLDAALRQEMRLKLIELSQRLPHSSIIYVTHDQVEAMTLADRIVVLSADGGIEQIATADELYNDPSNLFVATFIGSPAMNIIPATIIGTGDLTRIRAYSLDECCVDIATSDTWQNQPIQFGVRPDQLHVASPGEAGIDGHIKHIEQLGAYSLVHVEVASGNPWLIARLPGITSLQRGNTIRLAFRGARLHLFDVQGKSLRRIVS